MPDIIIENLNNIRLSCSDTANTVLNILHTYFIDWMHACGGKGRCTTCAMEVVTGQSKLSSLNDFEKKYVEAGKLGKNERLACQSILLGDIVIRVPERNMLPHISYTPKRK